MPSTKRNEEIDFIRGLAIVMMIFIHSLAYYYSDKTAFFLWNWGHFVVPLLLYASSYVFFIKNIDKTSFNTARYYRSRMVRLVRPYYIFLLAYLLLLFIFELKKVTVAYVLNGLLMIGGPDISWMVLLITMLALINPFVLMLWKKNRRLFVGFAVTSLLSSIILFFFRWSSNYKIIMLVPWLMIPAFSLFTIKNNGRKLNFIILAISGIVFCLFMFLGIRTGKHQALYNNKYPPNIYYLSYGLSWIIISRLLYSCVISKVSTVRSLFVFFSRNSYQLFFLHYLIIYLFSKMYNYRHLTWWMFFVMVIFLSVVGQMLLNMIFPSNKKALYLKAGV